MHRTKLASILAILAGLVISCSSLATGLTTLINDDTSGPNGSGGSANRLHALVPWPDLDTPSATTVMGGEKDAVVIVALEYYTFVPPVPGALANGQAWQRYFTSTLGVSPDRIRFMSNSDATKHEIEQKLDEVAKLAQTGGRVWFVFIGHGAPSRSGQDGLLLGADAQANTNSIEARSLRHSEVIERLEKSQAQPVIVLDACYSGQTASEEALCVGCQSLELAPVPTPKRAIVLSAAKSDQVAGPLPGRAQPAFSYLALGALRGWGDADGNGTVTASEVIKYANGTLGAVVNGRSQTPELQGNGGAILAKSAGERGPDLAEIQRILTQGGSVSFNGDGIVLTELPTLTLRDVGMDELSGDIDLSKIDIAKEKELEAQWLALQAAKKMVEQARAASKNDPTGVKQEKAWCELAALTGPNPYRNEATKACTEVRTYVEQRKRLLAGMRRDWYEKVVPFMSLQHRSVEDKQKVMQAFVNAYGVLAEQALLELAVEANEQLERGTVPDLVSNAGMVLIAGGRFDAHTIVDFHLDKTEVTVAEYRACVDAGKCHTPRTGSEWCNWGAKGKDGHPINCVSALDGDAYCEWMGGRLPTEWEWEWAARSRNEGWTFPWGDEEPGTRACWERTEPKRGTCEVGSFTSGASVDGVLDLAGNVWEWTSSMEGNERVIRGGSWKLNVLEASTRLFGILPSGRDNDVGFRCVRTK